MRTEVIFGNKESFGIRYIPGWKTQDGKYEFATLHLLLKGQVIGDPNEVCLVGSWLVGLEWICKKIRTGFHNMYDSEFAGRTDREVFELIWKSNQFVQDYKDEYLYLQQLNNEVWMNCNVSIDETTDAYLIVMTKNDKNLKFIWEGWREPCPLEEIGKLDSVEIEKDAVIDVMNECLSKVEQERHNFEIKE